MASNQGLNFLLIALISIFYMETYILPVVTQRVSNELQKTGRLKKQSNGTILSLIVRGT